jgi:hypothetical protein
MPRIKEHWWWSVQRILNRSPNLNLLLQVVVSQLLILTSEGAMKRFIFKKKDLTPNEFGVFVEN